MLCYCEKTKCFVAEHEEEQLTPWDKHLREKRQRKKERKRRNREKVGVGEARAKFGLQGEISVSSFPWLQVKELKGEEKEEEEKEFEGGLRFDDPFFQYDVAMATTVSVVLCCHFWKMTFRLHNACTPYPS